MNAQAEQLKNFVDELVMMVKGKNDSMVQGKARSIKTISQKYASGVGKKQVGYGTKKMDESYILYDRMIYS